METCTYCKSEFKTKYNLKSHLIKNKSCLKRRGIELISNFQCIGCKIVLTAKTHLVFHHETCKDYIKYKYEQIIEDLKKDNETKIVQLKDQYERTINEIKNTNERTIDELRVQNRNLLTSFEKVATHAVDRPTTTINNIKNQFSDKYFMDNITQEEVKRKCQNYLTEEVFLEGQRGIAKMCTDHIIKTKDHKALIQVVRNSSI